MSGGGGGYAPPQDNSLALQQMQYAREDAERQRKVYQDKQDKAVFDRNLRQAVVGAQGTGRDILTDRGLDYSKYGSVINRAIQDERTRIPSLDPNPGQYFTSDLINDALTGYQSNTQTRNTGRVNGTFGQGFENTLIPDTLDDSYINTILGTQEGKARQALQAAQQRGQLTDVGLNAANSAIDTQRTGARSTLDSLGGGVLSADRDKLKRVRDNAITAGNSWQLGDPDFSLDPYTSQRDTELNRATSNLEGDLNNALGGTQLFDVNSILLSGSQAQGPRNLTTANVPGRPVRRNNTDRGLGSEGSVF